MRQGGSRRWGIRNDRFLDPERRRALVGVYTDTDGVDFETVDFGPSQLPPVEGTVDELSRLWCRRLALRVDGGKILPAYVH